MKNRTSFPEAVQTEVLTKCRRRCVLCYVLDGDARWKDGQIAHIDRNPANAALENAAYLCLNHHNEYDGTRKQSKRFQPDELKHYQRLLYEAVPSFGMWPDARASKGKTPKRKGARVGISLAVYDRRIAVYRTTRQFVRDVAENLRPEIPMIFQFATDTDEALFLFDEDVAAYLETLFTNAFRLHTIELMRERMLRHPGEAENFQALSQEETGLALWFTDQPGVIRARFAPFLQLASKSAE
jgi:hypothetical protein